MKDVTGVVLAGGFSSRFGNNKAFAVFHGKEMIRHALDVMKEIFNEVIVVTNSPGEYINLGIPIIKDIEPHKGPLGGIITALCQFDKIFVSACDMPFITKTAIEKILSKAGTHEAVISRTKDGIQPLFAVYRNSLVPHFKNLLNVSASVAGAVSQVANTAYVDIDEKIVFGINTPEEMNV